MTEGISTASGTILVTGATGFIAKALSTRLAESGHAVRGAVRRTGVKSQLFQPVPVGAIDDVTHWTSALQDVDTVFHLAARVHVMDEQATDPLNAFRRVNVVGTLRLARKAAEVGVRRFVFISSVKVNGEATAPGTPFSENDPLAPRDPYGISKREAEEGLRALSRETGLEVVIIRPPLVHGPGVGGNLASLFAWIARGVPLPLGAVTDNRRSLVGLDNLVDLLVTCIDHPAAAGEVFLVSDGEDVSTADLLRRLGRAMDRPPRLLPVPVSVLHAGAAKLGRQEMAQRLLGSLQVDITKAKTLLGWEPSVSLDEGLRRATDCQWKR